MAIPNSEIKIEEEYDAVNTPAKRIKLSPNDEDITIEKRTVATMCGSWRGDEEDGGMILVFKTRKSCLSPDPIDEKDLPENIEDFWVATLQDSIDNKNCKQRHLLDWYRLKTYKHFKT